MRPVLLFFALAAGLIVWLAVARLGESAAPPSVEEQPTRQLESLEILARTPDGAPATALRVLLEPIQTLLHSERRELELSAPDGRYVLDGLSPGSWELTPLPGPWRTVEPRGRTSITLPTKRSLEFIAEPPGALTIRVEDAFGRGLEGVEVEALALGLPPADARTDADGECTFDALPTGDVRITARKGKLVVQERSFVPSREHPRLALTFPGGGIEGHLLDSAGRIASDLDVGLRRVGSGSAWSMETTADGAGAFHFGLVAAGRYEVGVHVAGRVLAIERVDVVDGRTSEVSLTLESDPRTTLAGRLFLGRSVAVGVELVFVRASTGDSAMDIVRTRTNAQGRFRAQLPGGGTWAALGQLPGRRGLELDRFEAAEGATLEVNLTFPTGQVVGRVRAPNGLGLADARVEAVDARGWVLSPMRPVPVTTASDGSFELDGLLPGIWTLHVQPRDLAQSAVRSHPFEITRVDREAFVDLQTMEAGSLRVVFASEALVTGDSFAVYVRDASGDLAFSEPRTAKGTRELEVRGLPPGTYRAIAVGEGRVSSWSEPARVASGEVASTSVELRPAGWTRIALAGGAGATIGRVELIASDGDGASVLPWAGVATEAGQRSLLLGPLPAGDYALQASSTDGSSGRAEATVDAGETVDVRLELR